MKMLKLFCLFAVVANFLVQSFYFEQRTTEKQLFSMAFDLLSFILVLISFILGFGFFRRKKFRAFIPFLICFLGLPASLILGAFLGGSIKELRFQKNLPRFNEAVNLIQKGELKPNPSERLIVLPPQYTDLAIRTFVHTNSDGTNIEFFTELGFPVKHSGYLYVSSGKMSNSDTLESWPFHHRINTNWFYISD